MVASPDPTEIDLRCSLPDAAMGLLSDNPSSTPLRIDAGGRAEIRWFRRRESVATSRLLPAILEQHQRADGGVAVPEVLRRWLPEVLSVQQPS